jgi:beta-glucosidase
VPVYVHQPVGDVVVPPLRLVAFARTRLDSGQSKTVQVSFRPSVLAVTPGDIDGTQRPAVEPGSYQIQAGSLTANFSVGA